MMADMLFTADGVTKNSVASPALDNVSMAIRAIRSSGLIGPNGAGKTNLLQYAHRAVSGRRRQVHLR